MLITRSLFDIFYQFSAHAGAVQYDINPVGHFRQKPKLEREAVELGWRPVTPTGDCSNGGQYYGFRYIEPEEDSLVLIFDVNGVIAGMQMLVGTAVVTILQCL